jgi:hypothetical protein
MIQEFVKYMMLDMGKTSPQSHDRYVKYLIDFKQKVEADCAAKYKTEMELMKKQIIQFK